MKKGQKARDLINGIKMAEMPKKRLSVSSAFLFKKGKGANIMNAKVVIFQIKPGKQGEVVRLFKEFVIPGAEKQKGFKGGLLLTDPNTGKATSIALWETEADIKASEASGYYKEWVAKLSDAIALPPVREIYEVSNLVNLSVK